MFGVCCWFVAAGLLLLFVSGVVATVVWGGCEMVCFGLSGSCLGGAFLCFGF